MHRPAIDIHSGGMLRVTHTLLENLPRISRTAGRAHIYVANGRGGWEAAVSNVLSPGQTVRSWKAVCSPSATGSTSSCDASVASTPYYGGSGARWRG
jgi:hypothetical protein